MSFYPFTLHEISVLVELILGHLRYLLADVPPQPNSPSDTVLQFTFVYLSLLVLEKNNNTQKAIPNIIWLKKE